MNTLRRFGVIFGLVAAIVAPTSAFAADSTSDTVESLSVASTVSMTAPATATFTLNDFDGSPPNDFGYDIVVTVIGSNNPTGVTLKAKVDPWVGPGAITVATTGRAAILQDLDCVSAGQVISQFTCPSSPAPSAATGAALTKAAGSIAAGQWANSTTSKNLASSTGPLANADLGVTFYVQANLFSVGGTYTSAVHYTTSTNP